MHRLPERKFVDQVRDIARLRHLSPRAVLTTPIVGGDVVGSYLICVANQKLAAGHSRLVPRLAFDSCEARDLGMLLRRLRPDFKTNGNFRRNNLGR